MIRRTVALFAAAVALGLLAWSVVTFRMQRSAPPKSALDWSMVWMTNAMRRVEAEAALRAMGPPAAKELTLVIERPFSRFDLMVDRLRAMLPPRGQIFVGRVLRIGERRMRPAAAANGLAVLGPAARAMVPRLEAAVPNSDVTVYGPLFTCLKQISPEGVQALGRIARSPEESRASHAALEIGSLGTNAIAALPDLLWCVTHQARSAGHAALAIGAIGESAIPAVTNLLASSDTNLCLTGLMITASMGPRGAPLLEAVLPFASSTNLTMRISALHALGQINPTDAHATVLLKEAARDPNPRIRQAAVEGLRFAPARVWRDVELFDALTHDTDEMVRKNAIMNFGATNPLAGKSKR